MPKYIAVFSICVAVLCAPPALRAGGVVTACDEPDLLTALSGGGNVTFTCSGTITLSAPITLSADTTIDGTGQQVGISGNSAVQIFAVPAGVSLTLNAVTLESGFTTLFGGAIFNQGTVTVSNSAFLGNNASFLGGAIFNLGTLNVTASTFSGNAAPFSGGGAILNDAIANITASTFFDNNANSGGAVDNSMGTVTVINSTFFDNTASDIGGAILNDDTTTIVNCTIDGNYAYFGAGVDNDAGTVTLENSIVAQNDNGGNCTGVIAGGGNLSSGNACPGTHNANPMLGPLQFNGGLTDTMALLAGSPAIDAAIESDCPATDQRGVPRPQGPACDIGAYERASVPASGNTCVTYYNDTFNGNVNVSKGQNCGFVSGGVTGGVTVTGGNFTLSRATVQTSITVNAGTFFIAPFSAINGNLVVQNIPAESAQNQICGASVKGNVQVHNNATEVDIGSEFSSACPGNTVGGDLQVNNNTAETMLIGNTVSGNLQDHNNTALTKVIYNVVSNTLACQNNSSIIGGPNKAKTKQGQCY